MADAWQSIVELAETPATADDVLVRDISDTTDDAEGTVKRNSRTNFLGSVLNALIAAFTPASASGPASLALAEDTDNGSSTVSIAAPAAVASNKVATLQDVTGTLYVSGGTDVPVADGGTGASTAADARTNLGAAPLDSPTFTGTVVLPAATVTSAMLRNSAALSLIGRSANSAGVPADIAASAASGAVLRESGSAIGFGTVATAGIADAAVTYAKIQDVSATDRLLGRSTAGAGDIEEITCTAAARSILDDATVAAILATLGGLPLAGGTLTGALTLGTGGSITGGDKVASALELNDYAETLATQTNVTGALTIDYAAAPVHHITHGAGNISGTTINNWPASGKFGSVTVQFKQDATGGRTLVHPTGVAHVNGTPTFNTAANKTNIMVYTTRDGGTTVEAYYSGSY